MIGHPVVLASRAQRYLTIRPAVALASHGLERAVACGASGAPGQHPPACSRHLSPWVTAPGATTRTDSDPAARATSPRGDGATNRKAA